MYPFPLDDRLFIEASHFKTVDRIELYPRAIFKKYPVACGAGYTKQKKYRKIHSDVSIETPPSGYTACASE